MIFCKIIVGVPLADELFVLVKRHKRGRALLRVEDQNRDVALERKSNLLAHIDAGEAHFYNHEIYGSDPNFELIVKRQALLLGLQVHLGFCDVEDVVRLDTD